MMCYTNSGADMINWKEIEITDKKRIDSLICASGCHSADYCFANLYIWRNEYKPLISFNENRLLVGNPEWHMYAYPKGDGDVRSSIELLLDEAHSHGDKLVIRGLTDRTLREFLPLYGDRFQITDNRDDADYVYSANKLCNLPGRHLASKRNHINKFERNGEWEFRKLSRELFAVARDFLDNFYKEKADEDLVKEAIAIEEMFANYDELGFLGGLLYQHGEPVAFTAGTKLDEDVFDVHFEKALSNVEGAYTMVNREFARMVVEEYPEISAFNREEDMGLEGLRKAKLSYHPDIILMKYFATEK